MKLGARLILGGVATGGIFGSFIVLSNTPRVMAIWEAPMVSPDVVKFERVQVVDIDPERSKIRYDDPYPYYNRPVSPDTQDVCHYPSIEAPKFNEVMPRRPGINFDSPDIKLCVTEVSGRLCHPVRLPPTFPPRFLQGDHSGYCRVSFRFMENGKTTDVKVGLCTDDLLKKTTEAGVKQWVVSPDCNYRKAERSVKVRYDLTDESGTKLSLPPGF